MVTRSKPSKEYIIKITYKPRSGHPIMIDIRIINKHRLSPETIRKQIEEGKIDPETVKMFAWQHPPKKKQYGKKRDLERFLAIINSETDWSIKREE